MLLPLSSTMSCLYDDKRIEFTVQKSSTLTLPKLSSLYFIIQAQPHFSFTLRNFLMIFRFFLSLLYPIHYFNECHILVKCNHGIINLLCDI